MSVLFGVGVHRSSCAAASLSFLSGSVLLFLSRSALNIRRCAVSSLVVGLLLSVLSRSPLTALSVGIAAAVAAIAAGTAAVAAGTAVASGAFQAQAFADGTDSVVKFTADNFFAAADFFH